MRILKHGDLGKIGAHKFVCQFCGCEFLACPDEYYAVNNNGYAHIRCPGCTEWLAQPLTDE